MCGIAGIFSLNSGKLPALEHGLNVMNDIQKHRGPDGQRSWYNIEESIGFAHQRLSIIDLSTGDQPMTDEYGNTICYNGEVYNYIELRKELNGYPFKTSSDTEVKLAEYKKWGHDCVNHLRVMFAFEFCN
jgi:asparagine synthase (glutamine-hydrolysing)